MSDPGGLADEAASVDLLWIPLGAGAHVVRVHDVKETVEAAALADAILCAE